MKRIFFSLWVFFVITLAAENNPCRLSIVNPAQPCSFSTITLEALSKTKVSLNIYSKDKDAAEVFPISVDDIVFEGNLLFDMIPTVVAGRNLLKVLIKDKKNIILKMYFFELPQKSMNRIVFQNLMNEGFLWWSNGVPCDEDFSENMQICFELTTPEKYISDIKNNNNLSQKNDFMILLSGNPVSSEVLIPDAIKQYGFSAADILVAGLYLLKEGMLVPKKTYFNYVDNNFFMKSNSSPRNDITIFLDNQKLMPFSKQMKYCTYKINDQYFIKQKTFITLQKILLSGKQAMVLPSKEKNCMGGIFFTKSVHEIFSGEVSHFVKLESNPM